MTYGRSSEGGGGRARIGALIHGTADRERCGGIEVDKISVKRMTVLLFASHQMA